ncbi:MAG: hypothetical protein ACK58M_18860 [Acidobacteriota bacterium]|jgi:hypothetical protein|nr:hypothetical protein [Bryobacteraceae bacterium CoA2 C42]MCA2962356.1 hypothetical protein [Acidobacteriaceae bacterium]
MGWIFFLICEVMLPPSLANWQQEIEQVGRIAVVLLRLPANGQTTVLDLPPETPRRELLAPYTSQPGFVSQYRGAQAMTVNTITADGRVSFVLINPLLAGADEAEQAVIAHEFGHIWLKAKRYPAPAYQGGEAACLSIHALDAVQHILIRQEMERRGVAWKASWFAGLAAALRQMEQTPGAAGGVGRCQTLSQVAMWVDVALGAGDWPGQPAFLAALRRRFPVIVLASEEIASYLRGHPVADPAPHRAALEFVFARMKQLALTVP